jgi:phage baseplate assembly protein V
MSTSDRLHRRIQMGTARVSISATDDSGPIHRAQVRITPPETIDGMACLQLYGFASHAPVGSEAIAVFGQGDRSQGAIIATGNSALRPRNQPSGGAMIYDGCNGTVALDNAGNILITCKGTITVKADTINVTADTLAISAPAISIKGVITLDGDLHSNGTITAPNGQVGGTRRESDR